MPNLDYLDQFRYANKELKLTKQELQYQQIFTQAAMELYNEQSQVSHSIMIIKGISVEFLSDLLKWEKRNPGNKKSEARERVEILNKHIDVIAKVQTDNYALKWNAGKMREEIWRLKEENANLKHQLYLNTLNENEMPEDRR